MKKVDYLGNEIETGDFIVLPNEDERELILAEVVGWTEKKIKVKYINKRDKFGQPDRIIYLLINPQKYIKIEKEDATMKILRDD